MTYKEAKIIQGIVFDFNVIDGKTSYCCAVEPMSNEGEYYCYLYSDNDSDFEYLSLHTFAIGICNLSRKLCYFPDSYSIVKNENPIKSIRMW